MRDRGRPRFKFEIISEGRISLAGETIEPFPVEVLDRTSCIAEKLLARADRGRDESTHARDHPRARRCVHERRLVSIASP